MIVNSTSLPYIDTLIPREHADAERIVAYDPSKGIITRVRAGAPA